MDDSTEFQQLVEERLLGLWEGSESGRDRPSATAPI